MPRIRAIKPEFFRSPASCAVEPLCRILFAAMWCWADDFGVGETNINGLLGFAFPDEDEVTAQDVRRFCADIAREYGVVFYKVRGRAYYYIPSWSEHQKFETRESRRRYPPADDPDAIPDLRFHPAPDDPRKTGAEVAQDPREKVAGNRNIGTEELSLVTLVEGGAGGDPALAPAKAVADPKAKRGTRIRDDFMPLQETIDAIKAEFPGVTDQDFIREHRKFCDYWQSISGQKGTKLDWEATWRNWMRRAFERNIRPAASPTDQKVDEWSEIGRRLEGGSR